MANQIVELHCAYQWDCDSCGAENFSRAITLSPDECDIDAMPKSVQQEYREYQEAGEEGIEGMFMTRPDSVTCSSCGATFDVETYEDN